jgi:hypothetical protein
MTDEKNDATLANLAGIVRCHICGRMMQPEVLQSPGGFYVGYKCPKDGPYSRESGYYPTNEMAQDFLQECLQQLNVTPTLNVLEGDWTLVRNTILKTAGIAATILENQTDTQTIGEKRIAALRRQSEAVQYIDEQLKLIKPQLKNETHYVELESFKETLNHLRKILMGKNNTIALDNL